MSDKIVNRVAKSKLQTIDLEDFYPEGKRILLDIKDWLYEGVILKEQSFREHLKQHPWKQYQDCYVALHCSTEAILPSWTYLLIATYLAPIAKKTVVGSLDHLETAIFSTIIANLDVSLYTDKPVIIKGCSDKPIPKNAYLLLLEKIQPVAKSIFYGEACSTVPLFKNKVN